jgi:signal transduction histidine kinase
MIVEDATLDERFAENPLVTGQPEIRFYAGMPLINPDGHKLGTICVIDTKPRGLTEQQNFALRVLSGQVMKLFELRRKNAEMERVHEMHNRLLTIIGHDLRAPVNSINGLLLLSERYSLTLDEYKELMPRMRLMVDTTNNLLFNLLHWAKSQIEGEDSASVRLSLKHLAQNIIDANNHLFVAKDNHINNRLDENHFVLSDKNMIDFVFRNLLLNSNKFMENGSVTLTSNKVDNIIEISIADTGPGIPTDQDVFAWGQRNSTDGTQGEKGSGFGLPMSKDFIERLGGRIWFTVSDHGTNFFVTLPVNRIIA